jgi:hypothetical protein
MKRDVVFVCSRGHAEGRTAEGEKIEVPLVPGVFKHLTLEELRPLLQDPAVLQKYTLEALRWAPWQCLREFPLPWLRKCLVQGDLRPGRRQAIEYLMDAAERRRLRSSQP